MIGSISGIHRHCIGKCKDDIGEIYGLFMKAVGSAWGGGVGLPRTRLSSRFCLVRTR